MQTFHVNRGIWFDRYRIMYFSWFYQRDFKSFLTIKILRVTQYVQVREFSWMITGIEETLAGKNWEEDQPVDNFSELNIKEKYATNTSLSKSTAETLSSSKFNVVISANFRNHFVCPIWFNPIRFPCRRRWLTKVAE